MIGLTIREIKALEGVVRELLGTVAEGLDDAPGSHDAFVRVGARYLYGGFDRRLREALGETPAQGEARFYERRGESI